MVGVKNSSRWPKFVFCEPPVGFDAVTKRGGPYFDSLAEFGFEVVRVTPGESINPAPRKPWTFVYAPVPMVDATGFLRAMQRGPCSVIFDVHFPIMHQESVIGSDEAILATLEYREVMLANLAAACAVTVSQEAWAADLAEVNNRVWFLPDIDSDSDESVTEFAVTFAEISSETARACSGGDKEKGV